ncbi:MAG: hypothetical protein F7C32_00925 [Desulfurococcales archaeon]|nr:hypothetical protein [Desulfurococcales archaeon]
MNGVSVWDTRRTLDEKAFGKTDRVKIGEALSSGRIIRLGGPQNFHVYLGVNEDYIMIPRTYCSCRGFYMNTLIEGTKTHCSHLAALEVAGDRIIDLSEVLDPTLLVDIILEVINYGRSRMLRRLIYK